LTPPSWISTPTNQGRGVFLHEFGHALGLHHYQGFDVMRDGSIWPLVGGPGQHFEPLSDDNFGYRVMYGSVNGYYNAFASAHWMHPMYGIPTLANIDHPYQSRCWGELTLPINFTIGNTGSEDEFVRIRIFLNNALPPNGYEYGWDLYSYFRWVGGLSTFSDYIIVPTPALPTGTYYICWRVEPVGVTEYDGQDNVAYGGASMYIHPCF
jgi:hypothetical protein